MGLLCFRKTVSPVWVTLCAEPFMKLFRLRELICAKRTARAFVKHYSQDAKSKVVPCPHKACSLPKEQLGGLHGLPHALEATS